MTQADTTEDILILEIIIGAVLWEFPDKSTANTKNWTSLEKISHWTSKYSKKTPNNLPLTKGMIRILWRDRKLGVKSKLSQILLQSSLTHSTLK